MSLPILRAPIILLAAFLDSVKSAASGTNFPSASRSNLSVDGFAYPLVSTLAHALPIACSAYPSVSPLHSNDFRWYRNFSPVVHRLRPSTSA